MAKPKRIIIEILKLLNQKPLKKGDIRTSLAINRKTEYENLEDAIQKKWVELDDFGFYHITTLGERHAESINIPKDSFNFEVFSIILGQLDIHSEKPKVKCNIEIERPDKIKEFDKSTKAQLRFLTNDGLWLPENNTNLKASVACVADSLLDNVAKDKELNTILDEEFRNKTTIFNFRDRQPGYDYRKRLKDLARTNFQILIEYKGEEWVNKQNFENMEKNLENNQEIYNKSLKYKATWKKKQKINKVIEMIDRTNYKTHEHRLQNDGLFQTKKDVKSFIFDNLKNVEYKNKKEIEQIIKESFNSKLLKIEKRNFYCLELDKEKLSEFYKSISPILDKERI